MARVFVIYVPEDYLAYDRITSQARAAKTAVEFDHMQVKQAWVPGWKGQCRLRIYNCDGAIVLIGKQTTQGDAAWELQCAEEFGIPMLGVHIDKQKPGPVPKELRDSTVIEWDWPKIARFIQSLGKGSIAHA